MSFSGSSCQEQHLRNHQIGDVVVNRRAYEMMYRQRGSKFVGAFPRPVCSMTIVQSSVIVLLHVPAHSAPNHARATREDRKWSRLSGLW